MKKNGYFRWGSFALACTSLFYFQMTGCGSGSSSSNPTPSPTGTPVTLSGTITANSSDLASISANPALSAGLKNNFRKSVLSADVVPAPGMNVTVTKVNSDGTEEQVSASTTTDAEGHYSIVLDSVTPTDAGQANFYYNIKASDSSGSLVLNSITAPTEDSTVPVSPGTTIGASALGNNVGGISGIPSPEQVNNMNNLFDKALTDLPPGTVQYPSNTNSDASKEAVLAMANGMSAAGGDQQAIYQGVLFESNFYSILTDTTSDASDAAHYVKKATLYGCDQPSQQPLSDLDANIIGDAMKNGVTYTPTQIVEAINASGVNPQIPLDTAVSSFSTLLANIENVSPTTGLETNDLIALNIKRNLTSASFNASTPLDPDQAIAFIESLNRGAGIMAPPSAQACTGNFNITNILAQLTQLSELASPQIKQVQIYADSGFGCSDPVQGHFMAQVQVYIPHNSALNVSNVHISGTNGISQDSTMGSNGTFLFNQDGVCVTHGDNVTYTVTVTLSDTSELTTEVTRNHPYIPEAVTTVDGNPTSNNVNNPDVFNVNRPLYTWLTPEEALAGITNAPENSVVKYTYEFSHIQQSNPSGPLNQCGFVSSGALYSVNNFLPTVDCDPTACSAAMGGSIPASDIICRMNIQVYLVDQSDNYLGQAAGHFPVFTVVQ